jgi:hypothetical protein
MKTKRRKTIAISTVINTMNFMLLNSEDCKKSERMALITATECILLESNQYAGYRYLNSHDMELSTHGTTLGVENHGNGKISFPDETRRHYF